MYDMFSEYDKHAIKKAALVLLGAPPSVYDCVRVFCFVDKVCGRSCVCCTRQACSPSKIVEVGCFFERFFDRVD